MRQDRPVSELEDQIARGFGLAPQVRDRVDLLMALWCEHDHGRPMLEADLGRLNLRYVQCRGERLTAIGRYGWVRLGAIRSPIDPVRLTNEGIELAETIARRRADYRQRRGAVRDAVLCWLDQPHDRTVSSVEVEDMGELGHFLGVQFTQDEVDVATVWLQDGGYVAGGVPWGSPRVVRPVITRSGSGVVDSGGTVGPRQEVKASEPVSSHFQIGSQINNFHNAGPANVANAGRDVDISESFTLTDSQRTQLRDLVTLLGAARSEALPEDDDVLDEASAALAIQSAAPNPDPGVVRRSFATITEVATRAGTAAGALTVLTT